METIRKIRELYERNRQAEDGFQYTVPSRSSYPYQWLWDSCIHAVVLSHFDIQSAQKELLSVTARQFKNGMLPHIIYWKEGDTLQFDWGVDGTSAITQPPIIAYATWRVYSADKNISFLEQIYPALKKYYDYLNERLDAETELYGIINPDESGEDNSPRFDSSLGLNSVHTVRENNDKRFALFTDNKQCNFDTALCMREHFWMLDVAFNAYLVEAFEVMGLIASTLNHHKDREVFYAKGAALKKAMREQMLRDGVCWSLDKQGQIIPVHTWALLSPLIADIYTQTEASNLIHTYLKSNAHFATPFPLPTTSVAEPGFRVAESMYEPAELQPNWRGPVWMTSNWIVYRGLKKYGFHHEARIVASTSRKLVARSGFREYYDPYTGAGMGASEFTWGGLILDMQD